MSDLTKNVRLHDSFYLKENFRDKPKEQFKFIANQASTYLGKIKNPSILDVGCACGDFLFFIQNTFPNSKLAGMDIMQDLINVAEDNLSNVDFFNADICSDIKGVNQKFDAVFMSGVHSIFDEYKPWIDNCLHLTKNGGKVYIFGLFNPEDVDITLRVRRSIEGAIPESGWNIFSKKTISNYLDKLGLTHNYTDFHIGIDIPKHEEDPLRAWTFKLENGHRVQTSGIRILYDFSLLEININDSI